MNLNLETEAYHILEKAIHISPFNINIWQDWAQLLYEQTNFTGAITFLEEGIRRNPTESSLYYQCAAICYEAGQKRKGLTYLENALLLDYENHYLLFLFDQSLKHEPEILELIDQYR